MATPQSIDRRSTRGLLYARRESVVLLCARARRDYSLEFIVSIVPVAVLNGIYRVGIRAGHVQDTFRRNANGFRLFRG